MTGILDTYQRVCVLTCDHAGDHLPFYAAPVKDDFGNKDVSHPRCLHVIPVPTTDPGGFRYRVIFEMIDPRTPLAGWHEVGREHDTLESAQDQAAGIRELEAGGDDVRNPRIEKSIVAWAEVLA